jgi:hypothetical protein
MNKEEIQQLLLQVKQEMGKPYPAVISAPLHDSIITSLTNFLRNGPERKVFLINCEDGDYEYDQKMTQDIEIGMDIRNQECFKITLEAVGKILGPPAKEQLPENMSDVITVDKEDISKEGLRFDDTLWTPEYEGGALYLGEYSGETRYWKIADEFIFLESGSYLGDGDFAYYTLVTITPVKKPKNHQP